MNAYIGLARVSVCHGNVSRWEDYISAACGKQCSSSIIFVFTAGRGSGLHPFADRECTPSVGIGWYALARN